MAVTVGSLARIMFFLVVVFFIMSALDVPRPGMMSMPLPAGVHPINPLFPGFASQSTPARAKYDRLLAWLNATNIFDTRKLQLHATPLSGFGLSASAPITAGELMLSIPRRLIFGKGSAMKSSLADVFNEEPMLGEMDLVTLHLLYEKAIGKTSVWAPYLDMMPMHLDSLLFWPSSDVLELQDETLSFFVAHEEQRIRHAYERTMNPMFERHPSMFPRDVFTLDNFKWAYLTFKSRRFIADAAKTIGTLVMLPFAELLNHEAAAVCNSSGFAYNEKNLAFEFFAHRAFETDEEVLLCYAPDGNSDLLQNYGFSLGAENRYNRMLVSPDPNALRPFDQRFIYDNPVRLKKEAKEITLFLCGLGKNTVDEMCRDIAVARLQTLLNAYPTTLSEDRILLNGAQGNLRTAIEYRIRMKMMLECAAEYARNPVIRSCHAYTPPRTRS